jgi:carbamoyl-phosphate synthase large subunit
LKDIGFTKELIPPFTCVKEAVFPFVRFPGIDIALSPEMKSTGEVMGIDYSQGLAYFKTQVAAGSMLPDAGNIFLSIRDVDKEAVIPLARELVKLGFTIYATRGTATTLYDAGIKVNAVFKISQGHPNVVDMMEDLGIKWIINTPSTGASPKVDEIRMRARATMLGVPITTTISGLSAAVDGLKALQAMPTMEVCSLQEYHRHAPSIKI